MKIFIGKDATLAGSVKASLTIQDGGNMRWFRKVKPAIQFLERHKVDHIYILNSSALAGKLRRVYDGPITALETGKQQPRTRADNLVICILRAIEKFILDYSVWRLHYVALHWLILLLCRVAEICRRPVIFARLFLSRIGHEAYNTHILMIEMDNLRGKPIIIALYDAQGIANRQLWTMQKRHFSLAIKSPRMRSFLNYPIIRRSRFFRDANWYGDVHEPLKLRDNGKVYLTFTEQEEEAGKVVLEEMGIGPDDWFVCLHSRDKTYLDQQFPGGDWRYHDYRDCDIDTFMQAAEYISQQGGYVVRLGSAVAKPLVSDNPRIIDYASEFRSDFGDIYLLAKCKFLLCSPGGFTGVAVAFRRPTAVVNWIHHEFSTAFLAGDLFIPQLLKREDGRYLSLSEILAGGAGRYVKTQQFADAGLEVINNDAADIYRLAYEMNTRLDGVWKEADEDKAARRRFRQIIDNPVYLCAGTFGNVGANFVLNREWWLG